MDAPDRPAAGVRRRDMLVGGLLAATGVTALAATPRRKDLAIGANELDKVIPLTIGPWRYQTASGLILPPADQLADDLYDQQLTRVYEPAAGALVPPVMLLIAYGSSQSGMLQVHRPETCYPASGFRLTPTSPVDVVADGKTVPAQYFSATRELRTERVLYWTRVGNAMPRTWSQQRLAVMSSNLRGRIPDGVLVRMSTLDGDDRTAGAALTRFADLMVGEAGRRGRRLLVGGDGLGG